MAKERKRPNKFPAMITYIIAVLSLLVGLIFPLGTKALAEGGLQFNNMPILQIEGALVELRLISSPVSAPMLNPAYSWQISLFGTSVNIGAILLLAYIFVTAFAVILLIPVCVSGRQKETARKTAITAELMALIVLFALVIHEFVRHTNDWNLSVFIPFGVTALMLIIQSIVYFKGSGVIKTVAFILSALAVVVAVSNIRSFIPRIGILLAKMKGTRPFETTAGLYSLGGTSYFGRMLMLNSVVIPADKPEYAVVNVIALVLIALVCVNFLIDMFGLGKAANRQTMVINCARYVIELMLIAVLYGAIFWFMGSFGLCLYMLTVIALGQLIVAIARYVGYKEVIEVVFEEDDEESEEIAKTDYVEKPIPAPKPAMVRSVSTEYNGPSDAFIEKLSTEQKTEFAKLFLEHGSHDLEGIPDYTVGGDNSKFFSAIFIYLARVRDRISDGLMDKLYEEANA